MIFLVFFKKYDFFGNILPFINFHQTQKAQQYEKSIFVCIIFFVF